MRCGGWGGGEMCTVPIKNLCIFEGKALFKKYIMIINMWCPTIQNKCKGSYSEIRELSYHSGNMEFNSITLQNLNMPTQYTKYCSIQEVPTQFPNPFDSKDRRTSVIQLKKNVGQSVSPAVASTSKL